MSAAKRSTGKPQPANATSRRRKSRYIMVGGFLGAGKTTVVGKLARHLTGQGLRVGLVTNDQGRNLVDTALLRAQGFATEEIPGGCFCCRFDSLVEASRSLAERVHPEVFIAEPVGSCTDLVATVTYPLRRLFGKEFVIAPLSVLVDPVRALRAFGLEAGESFSDQVLYIYQKQLEEADLIVINKSDLLSTARLESLHAAIASRYRLSEVLAVSAREGTGLGAWFDRLMTREQTPRATVAVDYDVYADGEARLGWLNCTVQVSSRRAFDADAFLQRLAGGIQRRLQRGRSEIAHLKMTLAGAEEPEQVAVANLVRNDFVPEVAVSLARRLKNGQLILNLRAEAAPAVLGEAVRRGLESATRESPGLQAALDHLEHFRPGRPDPTHRDERSGR